LARAREKTYLWPDVAERVGSARDTLEDARKTLIGMSGDTAPILHRQASILSFGRIDLLDWVLFRLLVEGARLSRRQAYAVIAQFEGPLFRQHVEPIAIRKRLARLRTSPALIFAAPWEMLLFEFVGLKTTPGLLQSRADRIAKIAEAIGAVEIRGEDDYVRAMRVVRDLEAIQRSISAVYDPFVRQIEDLIRQMEEIETEGQELDREPVDDLKASQDYGRLNTLLARWAAWAERAVTFEKSFPDLSKRLVAMYRLMGTEEGEKV